MSTAPQNQSAQKHAAEVLAGERFQFGENWTRFLQHLDDRKIAEAEGSLKLMLGVESLQGRSFIDIGSGSGLFSLAARRLGAKVTSFDYDTQSVACTAELRRRYYPDDEQWIVLQGSVLDEEFIRGLGKFDIAYSWGVLHHTGSMWKAIANAESLAKEHFFISIYNDQGSQTRRWTAVKRSYVKSGPLMRRFWISASLVAIWSPTFLRDLLKSGNPLRTWKSYGDNERGMTAWHNLVDWVGGYPFETAKPEEIYDFFHSRGWEMLKMKTCGGGMGCNEFVFRREAVRDQ